MAARVSAAGSTWSTEVPGRRGRVIVLAVTLLIGAAFAPLASAAPASPAAWRRAGGGLEPRVAPGRPEAAANLAWR